MSRRRSVTLVAAVVALLAVVAVAALGRPLGNKGGSGGGLPQEFWNYALTTLIILVVLAAVGSLVAFAFFLRTERMERTPRSFRARTARTLAILIVGATLLYLRGGWLYHFFHPHPSTTSVPAITLPGGLPPPNKPGNSPAHFEWPEFVVFLGVLLAAAAIYATRSRARPRWPRLGGPPPELMVALDESLDDLRSDPDLRRAIIAAYARMERALAAAGVPRDPAEAPLEYVERVLLSLDASAAAVRRLTDLFEWARFSHHEPEPSMRDEAVDALVAVRDELREREPVETW